MTSQTCAVRVRVHDPEGRPLDEARVELHAEPGKPRALAWSDAERAFVARDVPPGPHRVHVRAAGRADETRAIDVGAGGTSARFVLGAPRQPAYYEGRVRVPFTRRDELLGVALEPHAGPGGEAELRAMLADLGIVLHEVEDDADRADAGTLRVFRLPEPIGDGERAKLAAVIRQHPHVRHVGPLLDARPGRVRILTDELIVRFVARITPEEVRARAKRLGLAVVRTIPYAHNAYLLRARRDVGFELLAIAQALVDSGDVVYAEPNLVVAAPSLAVTPSDVLFSDQWHAALVGLPDAWQTLRDANPPGTAPGDPGDLTYGSASVVIALLDKGIESQTVAGTTSSRHPEFAGTVTSGASKVAAFYDFVTMSPDNDTLPLAGGAADNHGMATAGVAAAKADNPSGVPGENEGIAGAAPNCRVLGLIRAGDASIQRYADAYVWLAGFDPGWVVDGTNYPMGTLLPAPPSPGADVVNSSFVIPNSGLMEDVFDFLAAYGRGGKGVVNVVAAGNLPNDVATENPMATHPKALAIAASSDQDRKTFLSAFGTDIELCAPSKQEVPAGPGIVTCDVVGGGAFAGHTGGSPDYRDSFGGTSSAAPMVAGVAALMLSIRPELTWVQVREILRATASKIDFANTDPVGQWVDTDGDGIDDFSQWYGYGRVDAAAAVIGARDFDLSADLVIRDNLADDGSVPSGGWHADSPDIWVRQADDPIPALAYGSAPPHQNARRGQTNQVYLRVKNVGAVATLPAWLRALICHYPGFEFRYPQEWIPTGALGSPLPSPLVPGSYLIGEVAIDALLPGDDLIVKLPWASTLIPPREIDINGMTVEWHPCLLADVTPHDGPPPAGATFDVKRDNNLAHKNITIDDANSAASTGGAGAGSASTGGLGSGVIAGTSERSGVTALVLDRGALPDGCAAWVWTPERAIMARWLALAAKGDVASARPLAGDASADACEHETTTRTPRRAACRTTLLDPARLVIDCGEGRVVVHAPEGTTLDYTCPEPSEGRPRVGTARVQGHDVLVFAGGSAAIELPLPLPSRTWIPLALGVRCPRGATSRGVLHATQRLGNGELSAGYSVRV